MIRLQTIQFKDISSEENSTFTTQIAKFDKNVEIFEAVIEHEIIIPESTYEINVMITLKDKSVKVSNSVQATTLPSGNYCKFQLKS